jgi:hypothetical protein
MAGKLLQQARKDARKFLGSGGFEEDIILSNPTKTKTLNLKGFHSKHFISFDSDGNQINSKNAHILISEKDLIESDYPYRNQKTKNIDLYKHRIEAVDQNGELKKYVINENYPSETFGLIICILADAE